MAKTKTLTDITGSKLIKALGILIVVVVVIGAAQFSFFVDDQRAEFKKRQEIKAEKKITTSSEEQLNLDQVASLKSEIDSVRSELNKEKQAKIEVEQKFAEKFESQNKVLDILQKEFQAKSDELNKSINSTNDKIDKTDTMSRTKYNEIKEKIKEIKLKNANGQPLKTIKLPPLQAIGEKPKDATLTSELLAGKINNVKNNNTNTKKIETAPEPIKPKVELFSLKPESTTIKIPEALPEGLTKAKPAKDTKTKKEDDKTLKPNQYAVNLGISKAITLMGVDAPTSSKGQSDPHPVLLTLDGSVINANSSTQSLDKCLLLATATGDLRTERANLRLSKISCVTADGKQRIEAAVQGWVIGEDGKPGLTGVVVTKAGSVLAKGLMAGFLQGVADAFSAAPTLLSPTQADGTTTQTTSTSFGEGFASGSSDALSTIADYYLEMAQDMYPVIEIKAGRKVSVLLKGGEQLETVPFNKLFIGDTFETTGTFSTTKPNNKVYKRL